MEHMPAFRLLRPTTLAEAVAQLAASDEPRIVAGGTDMVVNIRRGIERPKTVIELSAIAELTRIDWGADGVRIGAGVTLARLAAEPGIVRDFAAVAEAAGAVAGPTHRAYGTVGGNLCLDTRCLYYNQSEWWRKSNDYCLKHRGATCHVAPGGSRCFAAFSGDVAPALLVFGAEIELAGPQGARRIPLDGLYNDDGMNHLALGAGELLVAVHLKRAMGGAPSGYAKSRVRGAIDFPLAGAAVRLVMAQGAVAALAVALTGVNPLPLRVAGTDDFLGRPLDEDALDGLRELVRRQAKPMRTTTIKPWYRRRVVGALARRLAARLAAG